MLQLPFTAEPFRSFTTKLNGHSYQFTTAYNERSGVWTFDLADGETGDPIISGVPILIGCDLLGPSGLGIGSMYAIDQAATAAPALVGTTGVVGPVLQMTDADPLGSFNDDLGTRVLVVYLAPGESLA